MEPPVQIWLGGRALAADDVDRAIQYYSEAMEGFRRTAADPKQHEPFINRWQADLSLRDLGRLYEQTARLAEAEHAYREAFEDALQNYAEYQSIVAIENGVGQVCAELITFLKKQGRGDEANRVLQSVIQQLSQRELEDAESYVHRGILLQSLPFDDRYSHVPVPDFEQALKLEPDNMGALFGLFVQRMWAISPRDSESCLSLAKRMVEVSPHDRRGWKALAHWNLAHNRLDEAEAAVSRWLECDGAGMDPLVSRAEILEKRGDLTAALRVADQLVQTDPLSGGAWLKRGEVNSRLGAWQAAVDDFKKAIHLNGNAWHWYKRLARASFQCGDYATAWTSLQTAFRLCPEDLSTLIWISPDQLAACPDKTLRQGIVGLADQAVERDGARCVARVYRAQLRLAVGNKEGALADINAAREILETNSDEQQNRDALNALAWLLATAPEPALRDSDQALTFAMAASRQAPEDYQVLNTLGVAYYRAGQWQAAIETLDKSVTRSPQNMYPFNGFFLAMANWQLGHQEDARRSYQASVESMDKHAPADEELRRFRAEAAELLGIKPDTSPAKITSPTPAEKEAAANP